MLNLFNNLFNKLFKKTDTDISVNIELKEENKKLFNKAIQLFENKEGEEYQYILRRLNELSSDDCLDDYMYDTCNQFKLNMDSMNDYKNFIDNDYELYSQISPALFIRDNGTVSLQKTYNDAFIYIVFNGNHKVDFIIDRDNNDKFIKNTDMNYMIDKLKKYIDNF